MSDVHAPALPARRRLYLFNDLTDGAGQAICSTLSAHDLAAEYRMVTSPAERQANWRAASALLFFVSQDVPHGRETVFTEVDTCLAEVGPLPAALLTNSKDPMFLKSCYSHGISQVLQTSLSVSTIVQSLRLIAHGHAFVPIRLLITT